MTFRLLCLNTYLTYFHMWQIHVNLYQIHFSFEHQTIMGFSLNFFYVHHEWSLISLYITTIETRCKWFGLSINFQRIWYNWTQFQKTKANKNSKEKKERKDPPSLTPTAFLSITYAGHLKREMMAGKKEQLMGSRSLSQIDSQAFPKSIHL